MTHPETALHYHNPNGSPYGPAPLCVTCDDRGCDDCDEHAHQEAERMEQQDLDRAGKCGACLGHQKVHPGVECDDCEGTGKWNAAAEARVQARRASVELEPIPFS